MHVHDYATIRALLRDPLRVTADVTRERVGRGPRPAAPGERVRLGHRPSDDERVPGQARRLAHRDGAVVHRLRGRRPPGHHAGARPRRWPRRRGRRLRPLPRLRHAGRRRVHGRHGWASSPPTSTYAIDDQLDQGEFFEHWPMLSTAEMDEHYRALMARPELGGVAAEARDARRGGRRHRAGVVGDRLLALGQRGRHRRGRSRSPSGLVRRARDVGPHGRSRACRRLPSRRRSGSATRSPRPAGSSASRSPSATSPCEPGDQVLMWLTAANRDLPGPHRQPLDRFDPRARQRAAPGLRLRLPPVRRRAPRPRRSPSPRSPRWPSAARSLRMAGPWKRFVGIDDGYVAAPAETAGAVNPPIGLRAAARLSIMPPPIARTCRGGAPV